jgi:pantoate--beta-alanine ligase
MKIIDSIKDLQDFMKNTTSIIGFVPTMGAMHEGHISLIQQARKDNDIVIVSIFVNPTQFLENEDLNQYPKKLESDITICKLYEVDIIFTPKINDIYSKNELSIKAPKLTAFVLEGRIRPGHFDGVLQIVLKLFNLINPTNAYFGKKDAQQLILIKQMVKNLFLNINIIECKTKRESSGLALSSRNTYLNKDEKVLALRVSKSLREANSMVISNKLNCKDIISNMKNILYDDNISIEYIEIVDCNINKLQSIQIQNSIILVAVKIGTVRLIDNLWL